MGFKLQRIAQINTQEFSTVNLLYLVDSVSTASVFLVVVSASFMQLNARSQSAEDTTRVFTAQCSVSKPSGNRRPPSSTNSRKA